MKLGRRSGWLHLLKASAPSPARRPRWPCPTRSGAHFGRQLTFTSFFQTARVDNLVTAWSHFASTIPNSPLLRRLTGFETMTIGVAASGENAGAAARAAVLGAELLDRGAIGGFAVLQYPTSQEAFGIRSRSVVASGLASLPWEDIEFCKSATRDSSASRLAPPQSARCATRALLPKPSCPDVSSAISPAGSH
ncbi:MAG: hypothetical protein K0S56_1037 [Microvirga sp.]|jgi:hypothetical protein|nr:hypothetical protein [Microvirga sp.]